MTGIIQNGDLLTGTDGADSISIGDYPGAVNASAGAGDDTVTGDEEGNLIYGGDGSDSLDGGEGNDQIYGGSIITSAPQPGDGNDTISGGGGNDILRGGSGDDVLLGGIGNDNLRGDLGNDTLDGGDGYDFVSYRFDDAGVTSGINFDARTFAATAEFTFDDGRGGVDTVKDVEHLGVTGSAFDDVIRGSEYTTGIPGFGYANQLHGYSGNDQLYGGPSNDLLDGGTGGDFMAGGGGDDVYIVDQAGDGVSPGDGVLENAGEGTDEIRTYINWGLGGIPDVENLTALGTGNLYLGGNALDNVLTGNGGDNYMVGEGGNDVIAGGDGRDIAAFRLPPGTTGTLRVVDAGDGSFRVQLVQADGTFEDVFAVTPSGPGSATVTGLGSMAGLGTDSVTSVEDLHFYVDNWPAPIAEGQFANIMLAPFAGAIQDNFAHVEGSVLGDVIDVAALYPGAGAGVSINVFGNGGDDLILGNGGFNYIRGGAGNDVIDGGGGNDSVAFALPAGTTGALRVVAGSGDNVGKLVVERVDGASVEQLFIVSFAGDGTATVQGINSAAFLGTDTVSNVRALDFLVEGSSDPAQFKNILIGASTSGDDFLGGGGGSDAIFGGDGNDGLFGGGGDDLVFGQGGDDLYVQGGGGNDVVSGGDGHDFVGGQAGNDRVSGDAGDDYVRGDGGDDHVDGGAGHDRTGYYHVNASLGGATVSLLLQGQWQNTSVAGSDFLVGIESLSGTPFADSLTGDDAGNWLWGSSSLYDPGGGTIQSTTNNDTISAGGGDDLVQVGAGNHLLDGGAGSDWLFYNENGQETVGFTVSLALQGAAQDTGVGSWTIGGFENVGGSQADDHITGDDGANILGGGAGNDTLIGGAGNDRLLGDGGADLDTAGYSGPVVTVDDYGSVAGNDILHGGDGDDTLIGGGGNDLLDGGTGMADVAAFYLPAGTAGTYSIEDGTGPYAGQTVVVLTDGATSSVVAVISQTGDGLTVTGVGAGASLGTDTVTNVDRLVFGTAPTDGSTIPAGAAVLEIASGVAADGLIAGATVFMDSNGNGQWDEGEARTTTAADGTFAFLSIGSGPLVVVGGTNTDTGLPNLVTLTAPAGSTVINPLTTLIQSVLESSPVGTSAEQAAEMVAASLGISASVDLLNTDVFSAAAQGDPEALEAQKAAAVVVSILVTAEDAGGSAAGSEVLGNLAEMVLTLEAGEQVDLTDQATIEEALSGALDPAEISSVSAGLADTAQQISNATDLGEISEAQAEALTSGNELDNALLGGLLDDELFGFGGNDSLSSRDGDDRLDGGAGDDQLDGGAGTDTAAYDTATAGVSVNLATGTASGGAGNDTLVGIENVIGSSFADQLTGNATNNLLDGGAGADSLAGGGGDDWLTGGAGADQIDGGTGFDTADYSGSSAAVSINLASGKFSGGDAAGDVLVSIENVTGSAFDDNLVGAQGDNVLSGGAGRDTLNGGGGADQLWGGAGADLFLFKTSGEITSAAGSDSIMDFDAGGSTFGSAVDMIDLSALDANIKTTKKNDAFTFIGSNAFTGQAGQLRVEADGDGKAIVMGDVDGNGIADFTLVVHYSGTLGADDFLL